MDNDFSIYLLARDRVAQLHAEARDARLAALTRPRREAQRPTRRRLSALRQRLVPLRSRGECGGAVV